MLQTCCLCANIQTFLKQKLKMRFRFKHRVPCQMWIRSLKKYGSRRKISTSGWHTDVKMAVSLYLLSLTILWVCLFHSVSKCQIFQSCTCFLSSLFFHFKSLCAKNHYALVEIQENEYLFFYQIFVFSQESRLSLASVSITLIGLNESDRKREE